MFWVIGVLDFKDNNDKVCFSDHRCRSIQIRRGQKEVPRVTLPSDAYTFLTPLRPGDCRYFQDRSLPGKGTGKVSTTFVCLQILKIK